MYYIIWQPWNFEYDPPPAPHPPTGYIKEEVTTYPYKATTREIHQRRGYNVPLQSHPPHEIHQRRGYNVPLQSHPPHEIHQRRGYNVPLQSHPPHEIHQRRGYNVPLQSRPPHEIHQRRGYNLPLQRRPPHERYIKEEVTTYPYKATHHTRYIKALFSSCFIPSFLHGVLYLNVSTIKTYIPFSNDLTGIAFALRCTFLSIFFSRKWSEQINEYLLGFQSSWCIFANHVFLPFLVNWKPEINVMKNCIMGIRNAKIINTDVKLQKKFSIWMKWNHLNQNITSNN